METDIETIVTEDGRIMRAAGLVDSYARQVLCSTDEMRPGKLELLALAAEGLAAYARSIK